MPGTRVRSPFPTRLWLVPVAAILAVTAAGIVVNHLEGWAASPIAWRLVAAAVTVGVVVAKVAAGTRAAAVTGVVGTAVAVVLLVLLA